jgi:hypothetical protein
LPLEVAMQPSTAKENIKTCVIKLVK